MSAVEDEHEQRRLFKNVIERAELPLDELWMRYFSLGGDAGQFQVSAYINGAIQLPGLQQDLLSQALNEYLRERSSPERVPYSRQVSARLCEHGLLSALLHLLNATQMAPPERLSAAAAHAGKFVGVNLAIYFADAGQRYLVPLPDGSKGGRADSARLEVEGSMAGQAFQQLKIVASRKDGRLWVPMVNGSERLGVVEISPGGSPYTVELHDPALREQCLSLAGLIGRIAVASDRFGDALHATAHRERTSTDAQLIHLLLPARCAGTDGLVVAGALEPESEGGGDIFDYALSEEAGHLAIFGMYDDGAGTAGADSPALLAAVAVSAYRAARRNGEDLVDQGVQIDQALAARFGAGNHLSGILAEVDLATGRLCYLTAGHPPPVVLSQSAGSVVLLGGRRLPFGRPDGIVKSHSPQGSSPGLDFASTPAAGFGSAPGEHQLRPWDWLALLSDGITGAKTVGGGEFGINRFVDLVHDQMSRGNHPSEAARVALAEVAHHRGGAKAGDAAVVLARWAEAEPPEAH